MTEKNALVLQQQEQQYCAQPLRVVQIGNQKENNLANAAVHALEKQRGIKKRISCTT